jgi:hypothetical protein
VKFKPNRRFEDQIARETGPKMALRKRAQVAKRFAIGAAPHGKTDNYARSIDVVERNGKVYLRTNDFAGHMVEFGSVNNPPYAPLRKGVRAAGLRLNETTK